MATKKTTKPSSKDLLKQLAINGGPKAVNPPLPRRHHFGKEEKAAVDALFDAAIESGNAPGYNGAEEEAFCKEFAASLGGGFADGVNSGTNAVFVALRALDLPKFSEVIFGCVTDPGGVMPIILNDLIPVPADTAPGSFNTGAKEIEDRITPLTSAIVVAHIAGEPADMPAIMAVAKKYNLPVVEDCAQAHMAFINGQRVGTFGTIGAFSLMFGKHMCTGGQGGAVFTKSEELYWKIRRAADRGKPFNLPGMTNVAPSLNCNLDEIHAAIGRAQLKKLPSIVGRRRKNVAYLRANGFNDLKGISIPQDELPAGHETCCWWWRLRFNAKAMKCTREEYVKALQAEGLNIGPNYYAALPFKMAWAQSRATKFPWNNPCYKGDIFAKYPTPNCDAEMDRDIQFYFFESYTKKNLDQILKAFQKVDAAYAK
jgi:dTDP-4-amino-4,6-dideoxygalactose transaminase